MKILNTISIVMIITLFACGGDDSNNPIPPDPEPPVDDLDFQDLIWSDEFDGDQLDLSNWSYEIGDGCPNLCGWGNNELQYYTDREENVSVSDGTLKITAVKEDFEGAQYTSARLITKGLQEFAYGKIEIRAKMAGAAGTWPALWMLGDDIDFVGWPTCGEIDIMEYRGVNQDQITSALHWPGNSGGDAPFSGRGVTDAETEFHVYELLWERDRLTFSVDGGSSHFFRNITTLMPFDHEFFFIFNVAMGGTLGGTVDPEFTSSTMEIDYIRIYQ